MNGLGKPYRKFDAKNRKKPVKDTVKLPNVNKKQLARNRIFAQTSFSHSTVKLELRNSRRKSHSLFRPTSCFTS